MSKIINVIILTFGMIISSYFFKQGLMQVPIHLHQVEVKGVSEKIITSDHALWQFSLREVGDNLDDVNHKITYNSHEIVKFLKENGFSDHEIIVDSTEDGSSSWDAGSKDTKKYKFQLKKRIFVTSKNPEHIFQCVKKTDDLAKRGILFNTNVNYFYVSLNHIKNEMIHEATQNARQGAEQFARDSHAQVGHILSAHQGLFTIEDYQDEGDVSGFHKKIRVVNTIKFELQ